MTPLNMKPLEVSNTGRAANDTHYQTSISMSEVPYYSQKIKAIIYEYISGYSPVNYNYEQVQQSILNLFVAQGKFKPTIEKNMRGGLIASQFETEISQALDAGGLQSEFICPAAKDISIAISQISSPENIVQDTQRTMYSQVTSIFRDNKNKV